MSRAFLFVLDSFGIGGARDADRFGDQGSNTLLHIAEQCAHGGGDRQGLRSGPLDLPHMARMGLAEAAKLACGTRPPLADDKDKVTGRWGVGEEISNGKDTPSGHWEIAGVPVRFDWGYFQEGEEAFPPELVEQIIASGDIPGILGNCHASGTEIIRQLGEEHIRTGKPICYTSSDSVFQIAAHETMFGLERLYELCLEVRALVDPLNIGRVIARPFIGASSQTFKRTSNRRDYSIPPPSPTLLDRLTEEGRQVIAVGKISDIFAHRGISRSIKADGNMALVDATLTAMDEAGDGDLVFTNFVDFDMLYGHRRDVAGYAAALEAFDARIPELLDRMREGDLMILTADHGCDPTWRGTDHTRERVPILVAGPGIEAGSIGLRTSFADIGATVARHLELPRGEEGKAFLG